MLTDQYLKTTSDTDKELIAEEVFLFYRSGGFPYKKLTTDDMIHDFDLLKAADPSSVVQEDGTLSISNLLCVPFVLQFAPHFYQVNSGTDQRKKSMLDAFNDDKLLMKAIKRCLHNNETISGNVIRRTFRNAKYAFKTSNYYPLMVRHLYQRFAPATNPIIYDFSAGFGHRLLGALSLPYPATYIGVDPFDKSIQSNRDINAFCQANSPGLNKTVDLRHMGSEDFCDPAYIGKVDLAFSSPPYFNVEIYSDQPTQAAFNNDYQYFLMSWWKKTVINIHQLLKDGGTFIINVEEKVNGYLLADSMINLAKEHGFILQETLQMCLSQNTKYEPIFVLRKQPPPAAISASNGETQSPPPSISSDAPQVATSPASGSGEIG